MAGACFCGVRQSKSDFSIEKFQRQESAIELIVLLFNALQRLGEISPLSLKENRNFDFIVNNFQFFSSDKQQQTRNEIWLSYIEWNVDLKISPRGTKSVASAYSVLRYVHYELQFHKWIFLFIRVSGSVQ